MFPLTSVPVLLGVIDIVFSSIVVITPNGNFWNLPQLHSVKDMLNATQDVAHIL